MFTRFTQTIFSLRFLQGFGRYPQEQCKKPLSRTQCVCPKITYYIEIIYIYIALRSTVSVYNSIDIYNLQYNPNSAWSPCLQKSKTPLSSGSICPFPSLSICRVTLSPLFKINLEDIKMRATAHFHAHVSGSNSLITNHLLGSVCIVGLVLCFYRTVLPVFQKPLLRHTRYQHQKAKDATRSKGHRY